MPSVLVLSQRNQIHIFKPNFSKIHFNIIHYLYPRLPNYLVSLQAFSQNFVKDTTQRNQTSPSPQRGLEKRYRNVLRPPVTSNFHSYHFISAIVNMKALTVLPYKYSKTSVDITITPYVSCSIIHNDNNTNPEQILSAFF